MLARQGSMRQRKGRQAAASIWALVTLTTMLVALAVAVNAAWLGTATQEMRTAADAAGLAAADELVDDAWLQTGQPGVAALLQAARNRAVEYAALNRVLGTPQLLDISDPDEGDVRFGATVAGDPSTFTLANLSNPTALTLQDVNTTAVLTRRVRSRGTGIPMLFGGLLARGQLDMIVTSLTYLDRDVYGFRARTARPIPLVPLGILSSSWDNDILNRNGPDAFGVAPGGGVVNSPDGIPELVLELQLQLMGVAASSTVALLTIGTGDRDTQISGGVTESDLMATQGVFALGPTNTLTVPATRLGPTDPSTDYTNLVSSLQALATTGEPRIWNLLSSVNDLGGTATLNAFVVARVMEVVEPADPNMDPLRIRVQPSLLVVPQALTDAARSGVAHLLPSPYLARPRIIR
jgi:hypothetical protein